MSTEPDNTEEVPDATPDVEFVSVPDFSEEPLTVNVPSGVFSTVAKTVNFYYPYAPQTLNATISGTVVQYNVSSIGVASLNNAGFVFQTDQYNSKREGSGQ